MWKYSFQDVSYDWIDDGETYYTESKGEPTLVLHHGLEEGAQVYFWFYTS